MRFSVNLPRRVRQVGQQALHLIAALALAVGALNLPLVSPAPQVALAAPIPTVSVSAPANPFIGQTITLGLTFDNTDTDEPGYGPFIDLYVPVTGADGDDGLTFGSATYLGTPVTATALTFPAGPLGIAPCAAGQASVTHPYARDTTGAFVRVCGAPGDQLVVLELPFGSFTPSQAPAALSVTATISTLADVNTALNLRARGGFRYGLDPLDNPTSDPSTLSPASSNAATWPATAITPIVLDVAKTYVGPEDETATGPNFPRQYRVTADIAPGQPFTTLVLTDTLPNNLQFTRVVSSTPAATCSTPSTTVPGGNVVCNFGPVTGGAGASDASVLFEFYVPLNDASSARVIDPSTADDATSPNNASGGGLWNTLDSRDPDTTTIVNRAGPEHTLEDQAIAIQKGVANISDATNSPGDVLEYTLDFQISDFFAFNNVIITDTLSDGQRLSAGFAPTLLVNGNAYTLTASAFAGANIDVLCNYSGALGAECDSQDPAPNNGETTLVFSVSNEIVTRAADPRLIGGCINPVSGATTPNCATYNDGGTTGRIVYRAIIQDAFSDTFPSGDPSVDHGDRLSNTVVIDGHVVDTASLVTTSQRETDDSGAGVNIAFGTLTKTIYAVNGVACASQPCSNVQVSPGETVTYRLTYSLPSSDFEDLIFRDFVPLPLLRVDDPNGDQAPGPSWAFSDAVSAAAPPAGVVKFGPTDTFRGLAGAGAGIPAVSIDTANGSNTLIFTYGDFDDPGNTATTIDLLFTLTVRPEAFADGLYHTNQARVDEATTNAGTSNQDAIVQLQIAQPVLDISKGVIASDRAGATFSPASTGPVTFNAPGTVGVRWAGTLTSSGLITNPVNSNLSGVDAGDLVSFAIVVENTGRGGAFDVVISDTLPAGFSLPSAGAGLNLQVVDGTGAAVSSTALAGGLFGSGIRLDDPGATANPIAGIDPGRDSSGATINTGHNLVVITYDLQVGDHVLPLQALTNTATLANFAGVEGGPDHTPTDLTDTATVTIANVAVAKTLVATSEAHTSSSAVAVGEIVRYQLTTTLIEGALAPMVVTDTLPAGLIFLDDGTATIAFVSNGAGITSSTVAGAGLALTGNTSAVTPTFVIPGSAISGGPFGTGTDVAFALGTVTNSDRDTDAEFVVIQFNALVDNTAAGSNDLGDTRPNAFSVATGPLTSTVATSANLSVTVHEPVLTINKTVAPTVGDAGDTMTYAVTVTAPAGANRSTAFDVVVTDTLPSTLLLNTGSLAATPSGGASVPAVSAVGNTITVTVGAMPVGSQVVIGYTAAVDTSVGLAATVTNTAAVVYTSLPDTGTAGNPTGSNTPGGSGAGTGERNGSGSPALNDHRVTDPASFSNAPTVAKTLVSTSEADTSGANLALGEIARYRLAVALPETTGTALQIRDNLPAGLRYLNDGTATVAFICNGGPACITSSTLSGPGLIISGNTPITPTEVITASGGPFASGTDPVFSLGNVVNLDRDADAEYIVIEFNALAENVIGNQAGTSLSNTFTLIQSGSNVITSTALAATVVEPVLAINKTVVPIVADAGDTVTYAVTVTAPAGANRSPAYDVVVTDTLPSTLVLNTGSLAATPSGGASAPVVWAVGNTITVTVGAMPVGSQVVVGYTADVDTSIGLSAVITNTAAAAYTSLPGAGTGGNPTGSTTPGASGASTGERDGSGSLNDYRVSDPASLSVDAAPNKVLVATSATHTSGSTVAIGEIVRYRLELALPESTATNLQLQDNLPAGLVYLSDGTATVGFICNSGASCMTSSTLSGAGLVINGNTPLSPTLVITASGGPFNSGTDPIFSLGNVVNFDRDPDTEFVVVEFNALVENIASNQTGTARANTFSVLQNSVNLGSSAPITVTVSEPIITAAKSVTPTLADAADVITFTVTYTNSGPITAYDVRLLDTLPSTYTLNNSSLDTACGSGLNANVTGNTVDYTVNAVPAGCVVTVAYTATVAGTVNPGQTLPTTGAVTWTSLQGSTGIPGASNTTGSTTPGASGAANGERNGSGGVNDHSTALSAMVTVPNGAIAKVIAGTSDTNTAGSNVTIGEVITYTLTASLPEGTTPSLVITDALPAGLTYVTGSALVDTAAFSGTIGAGDPVVSTSGSNVIFTFSTPIVVAGDNDTGNNAFIVNLQARVADVAGNRGTAPQTVLGNSASLRIPGNPTVGSGTVNVTVVEPRLTIAKDISPNAAAPNDVITVTLTVTNTGTSPAHDVVLSDPLPNALLTGLTPVTTPSGFTYSTAPSGADTVVRYTGGPIPAGEARTFVFSAAVAANAPAGTVYTNTATANSTSLPGPDVNERTTPDVTGQDTLTITAVDLRLINDDGRATIQPGQTTVYSYTISNIGGRDASGVVVTTTVPANTTFVPGSSTAGWVCVPDNSAGSTCTLALGGLAAGATITPTFAVSVDAVIPVGVTTITNLATVGDDGSHGVDPTPSNNSDDDIDLITGAAPDLMVDIDDAGITTTPGGIITYTLTYTNAGNRGSQGTVMTMTVPAHTTFTGSGWTCTPNTSAGSTCVASLGNLAAGNGGTGTFIVTVNPSVPAGVTQINATVTIGDNGAGGADPTPANNVDNEVTPLTGATPDLTVTIDDGGITATPGGAINYAITYDNIGSRDATGTVLTITVPAHTTYTGSGWTCLPNANAGSTCTRTIGALNVGAGGSTSFAVTVASSLPAGVDALTATVTIGDDGAGGVDPTPANNIDTEPTPLNAAPDLSVTISDGNITTAPGGVITYSIGYSNIGNQTATGSTLTLVVPVNTTYTGTGWTCTPNVNAGSACSLVVGTLNPGASGSATFVVTVDPSLPAGTTQIDAQVTIADDGTNGADPTPTNNVANEVTPLVYNGLTVSKSASQTVVVPNQPVTFTVTITNTGSQTLNPVVVTDTLPVGQTYVSGSGSPAPSGTGPLVWSNVGPLGPGASATLTYQATAGAVGVYTNTVDARGTSGAGSVTASDSETVTVVAPSLAIDKALWDIDLDPIAPNYVTFTIRITNTGPSTITLLPLIDNYDATLLEPTTMSPSSTDLVNDGTLNWADLTAASPNGFGSDLAPGASAVVTTTFRIIQDVANTLNVARVSGARDLYNNLISDQSDTEPVNNAPTSVRVSTLGASDTGNSTVAVTWRTEAEVDTVAFRVMRSATPNYADAIAVGTLDAQGSGGGDYTLSDTPGSGTWYYWVVELTSRGGQIAYGPVSTSVAPSANKLTNRVFIPSVQR